MTTIGYARVSTADQDLTLQLDALNDAGCERIFTDHASGARDDRSGLADCLAYLRPGDTLVIWKLDRLGRSASHLVKLAEDLRSRDIDLVIITTGIDTRTPAGKMIYTILASVAEMERDLNLERTLAGLRAARARGRMGGSKPKLNKAQVAALRQMADERLPNGTRKYTITEIGDRFRLGRTATYRYLDQRGDSARQVAGGGVSQSASQSASRSGSRGPIVVLADGTEVAFDDIEFGASDDDD